MILRQERPLREDDDDDGVTLVDKMFICLLSICYLQKLEFHGVMRFYYQNPDPGSGQKVSKN